jgi:prepilin signal peptidase PulO-like enzyme (type II secretory pathway)
MSGESRSIMSLWESFDSNSAKFGCSWPAMSFIAVLLPFFLGILGAAFGSFVALVASRYDPDRFLLRPDMLSGRSRCDSCAATLGFFDLIPILSYLFLRGKCRHCGASFPSSLFFAEVIGAGIFLSAFFLFHRYVPIGTSVSGTLFFFE